MCGICGFVGKDVDFSTGSIVKKTIESMTSAIIHRGPDACGFWFDVDRRIALGHRRLSILDLSEKGHQPMISQSERYIISYNGEIYNCSELQKEIWKTNAGFKFKSTSDTEVLLEYISLFGVEKTLEKAVGMFGLACYDRRKNIIHLARDRFGEKSVYYGWNNGRFVFGSELKCFKSLPFFEPELDKSSVYMFLKYGYIKSPWSIYSGIYKILPGEMISVKLSKLTVEKNMYYSLEDVVVDGEKRIKESSLDECADELELLLRDTIKKQMKSDVPLGLFLSSGVDSALVSAIAQSVVNGDLNTYSIGSYDEKYNEAPKAKEYSKILGTRHHEYYLSDKECIDLLLKLPKIYDEPFAQPSAMPTYFVSKMAKKDVTVVLAGDGADELFAGYKRDIVNPVEYTYLINKGKLNRYSDLYDYLQYSMFMRHGFKDGILLEMPPSTRKYSQFGSNRIKNLINRALYFESMTFMESETLVKVDRASMSNSLEVREPFLDPCIVKFAYQLPEEYKYCLGDRKVVQKRLLERYIPRDVFDFPKKGFNIPINDFLIGDACRELLEWAFSKETIDSYRLLNEEVVVGIKDSFLADPMLFDGNSVVFGILVLQLWLENNREVRM